MTTVAAGCEQLQPDDLSVRGRLGRRRRSGSASPARAAASGTSGSEDDCIGQPAPPAPPRQQPFSHLSQLLRPAGADAAAAAGGGPLRCDADQCRFETHSRACLDAHAKTHAGRRFYECDVCRMRFTNGANLRRHRMRHTGVKPYECRACSKRFFRRDHLLEHASTHAKAAGRRLPWQCPICGKGFQRQIAMRAHYQNEHVRDADWRGVCRLCGFGAACAQSLHAHLASQHGLRLGSAPQPPLAPHHFLAPVRLIVDGESPPGSPRPSQVSPSSSQASPSSSQISPTGGQAAHDAHGAHDLALNESQSGPSAAPPGCAASPPSPPPDAGPAPAAAIKPEPPEQPQPTEHGQDEPADGGSAQQAPLTVRRTHCHTPGNGCVEMTAESVAGSGSSSGSSRLRSLLQERRPASVGAETGLASLLTTRRTHLCTLCGILFPDQTLYFLHKGCHAENNPWKCNICAQVCHNVYEFNSHLLSQPHQ